MNGMNNGVRHSNCVTCPECGRDFLERGLARHRKTHGVVSTKVRKVSASDKLRAAYRQHLEG